MALPPNNPHVARVALRVMRDTRIYVNTFHLSRNDNAVLGIADVQAMADTVGAWWQASYRNACPTNIVGLDVTATKLDPNDPLQAIAYINGPGTAGNTPLPGDVSAAVSWRTGLAGRKNRGRFYDFGMSLEQVNTNDTLKGSYIALLSSVAQTLLTSLSAELLKGVIFHRGDNTATSITGVIVDQLVDAMRRRLAGRGQ